MDNITLSAIEEYIYKNSKTIENFNNISDERKEYLLSLANKFIVNNFSSDSKLNYYKTIVELRKPKYRVVNLEYLEKYNLILSSNEELYFLLINILDPSCEIYKYYLQNYNRNIKEEMEEKFGFYNRDFLTLEKKYNATLLNNFIYGIKKDYSQMLHLLTACNLDFNIDIDRINEIKLLANNLSKMDENLNRYEKVNSCIFNTLNYKSNLGLSNESEILLFIVFSIDPNFNLLQIYEDECNIKSIEYRCKEEVGIYFKTFIDIENYLVNTNKVNISINTWNNETKKLH